MNRIIAVALFAASCAVATPHVAFAKTRHHPDSFKKASSKVAPWTKCVWGPTDGAYPSGTLVLMCGSSPNIFAVGNADLSDISDLKPVAYIDEIDGSKAIMGVEVRNKEYFYTVDLAKLPAGAKKESWYSADPALVTLLRSLEKSGALPIFNKGNEDVSDDR